ncbi:MAG: LysR family transcriptional regulator [Acidimicrobiales bacterium]
MNLDVESLRTFLAVVDHQGMTSAASQLGLSQSAVSWKIKRLEQRVGKPLLVRDGHAIRPSRDGRQLMDDARSIVEIHDRAANRLKSSDLSGTVRLGSNSEVDTARLSLVLGRFKRSHPAASIEFVSLPTARLEEMVDKGELDVGLIQINDSKLRPSDTILWTDELVWVTCCETLYDEGEVPLITFGDECFYRPLSEPMLTKHNIDYSIAFSGPSNLGVYSAVAAGLGVAVLGSRMLGGDIVEWERGRSLDPLPCVHQVARSAPGDCTEIVTALLDAIKTELTDPEPPIEALA